MKKTLLSIFAVALVAGSASAQCVPDPAYANASGNFFPDSATFIAENAAMAGVDYEAVIDIKTITDTAVSAGPISADAYIDAFKVHAVSGAPAGFSFTGGGTTYEAADPRPDFGQTSVDSTWWNVYGTANDPTTLSPVQGCLTITASAADVAAAAPTNGDLFTDYPVTVFVDARVANATTASFLVADGTWLSDLAASGLAEPLPVTDYVLRVQAANGVAEMLNPNVFDVAQSYPNPAGEEAIISFTNPGIEEVDFKVFNMLGALVHNQTVLSERGVNNIELNTGRMSSGLYIYTLSNGTKTFTKKMTVK